MEITRANIWLVEETITQIEAATNRKIIGGRLWYGNQTKFIAVDFDQQIDVFPGIELIINTNAQRIVWAGKKMVLEIS